MRKYCRVCWNTNYWRQPTGEAASLEVGESFVQTHGFGHEEWLFNFAWLQTNGANDYRKYKYGNLQPIGKYRDKYEGESFDVFVYTVAPDRSRIAVATITDVFVPGLREAKSAVAYMGKQGWLHEMKADLAELGIPPSSFDTSPFSLVNVRFEPENVRFFDPRIALPKSHKLYRINRYQPIDWTGEQSADEKEGHQARSNRKPGKKRSEDDRKRTSIEGTTYSPRHVILQNHLYDHLCDLFGKAAVAYEEAFVDLALKLKKKVTLFEIKIAPTAKSCIREAFGQILEYAIYPDKLMADKLIVVGDGKPTASDIAYLSFLRANFDIPIFYRRWDWETMTLEGES